MNKHSYHTRSLQEMPYSPQPTLQYPSFYYKTQIKSNEQKNTIFIGLQFHRISRYEEDHIFYLIQLFQGECKQIRLKIVDRYLLYGQISLDLINSIFKTQNYVQQQRKFFKMLQNCQKYFKSFIQLYLNPQSILNQQFDPQECKERFKELVIQKVKCLQGKLSFQ